jgi:hypothetical protein
VNRINCLTKQVPLHERKIFPKKLIEENEFRPTARVDYPIKFKLTKIIKPKQTDSLGKVTSIEFTMVDDKPITNQIPVSKSGITFKAFETKKLAVPISLEAVPRKEEILSEENYKKVIDNLTKHYVGQKPTDEQPIMPLSTRLPKSKSDNHLHSMNTFISSKSEDPDLRINIQSIANDYKIAAEIENRKNVMRSQARRLLRHMEPKKEEASESRPNSASTEVLRPHKKEMSKEKTRDSLQGRDATKSPAQIRRLKTSTPILNALQREKTKMIETKTENKVYLNFAVYVEPKQKLHTPRKNVDVPPVTIDPELAEMALVRRPFK